MRRAFDSLISNVKKRTGDDESHNRAVTCVPQKGLDSTTVSAGDSGYGTVSCHEVPASRWGDDDHIDPVQAELSDLSGDKIKYVTAIAQDMFNRMEIYELDGQAVDKLSRSLLTLMGAWTFDSKVTSQLHYNMMVFIHRYTGAIIESFRNMCQYLETARPHTKLDPARTTDESRPVHNKKEPQKGPKEPHVADGPASEIELLLLPGIDEYKRIIFSDPGYWWVLDRLRREVAFSNVEPYVLDGIRSEIRRFFHQTNQIDHIRSIKYTEAIYTFYWDIVAFLRTQEYDLSHADAIATAITVTGSATDAQALSCREYLTQIWPQTGHETLGLVQDMLRSNGTCSRIFTSPGRLSVSITIDGHLVSMRVSGVSEFVIEIGEQFAWLGASLRSSSLDSEAVCCTPQIKHSGSPLDFQDKKELSITYKIENKATKPQNENGQCWHKLFANPVIVCGFPIPKRLDTGTGLEISLDMLVALAQTRYVDTFKSKAFIKGFSTMLIPTKQSRNLLIWHLLYNQDPNERISYLDCGLEHVDIPIHAIEQHRHVLGWCTDAVSIVGTTRANYNIETSRLPYTHSGCALEKAEISGGQFVTGTAVFSLGNREKPVHISRLGYVTKLQWISSKYFVFWDEAEKRGWLVNGASALLHILRASLEYSRNKLRSVWLLDPSALDDVVWTPEYNSALEFLVSEKNRDLQLYVNRTEVFDEETSDGTMTRKTSKRRTVYYRLEDRIEHIYNILEKLIDHQTDAERRSGLEIKFRPRRHLEGWDFKDLAADGDPFFARVSHLQTMGKGWVDFTRALHAVTLFGRGFGDLIQPELGKGNTILCSRWSIVPRDKYYLVACNSDLQEIMESYGDPDSNPRRLCGNIIWQLKQGTFDLCSCTKGSKCNHNDPVQVLFPLDFMKNFGNVPQVDLENRAAVIFGHNMNIHWHWKDHGSPVKGDPPQEQTGDATDTSSNSELGISSRSSGDPSTPNTGDSTSASSLIPPSIPGSPSSPGDTAPKTPKRRFSRMSLPNFRSATLSSFKK